MKHLFRLLLLLLVVGIVSTTPAWAQVTATWTADGTYGYNVSTVENWDTGLLPTTDDTVYIANGTTALVGAGNTFGGDLVDIFLGNGAGTSGNLTQTGGDVTATHWLRIGYLTGTAEADPTSVYAISGGTTTVSSLTVVGLGGKGKLALSGGDAQNPGGSLVGGNRLYVGDTHGTGIVEMSEYSSLVVPYLACGYRLSDNVGTISMVDNASFTVAGPSNSSSDVYIGTRGGGTGTINMTDDTTMSITTNSLYIGHYYTSGETGYGSLNLSGNADLTVNCMQRWTTDEEPTAVEDSYLYIGNGLGCEATLTMSGHSTMTTSNDNSNSWAGQLWVGRSYSTGTIDLSGGTGYDEATRGAKLVTTNMSDIGSYGNATDRGVGNLNVHEYAQFETAGLCMGDGGTGNLLIEGHGQVTVTDGQWMRLGFFSTGIFNGTIKDNGLLTTTGDMRLGDNAGVGTMTLLSPTTAGDSATINIGGRFFLGTNGNDSDTADGTLTINTGTSVTVASSMYVGEYDNANGTLTMNGGSLTTGGWLCVGRVGGGTYGATGIVTMNDDATAHASSTIFAGNSYNGGSGTITVNDNAQLSTDANITVAWGGVGVLNVGDSTAPAAGETGAVVTAGTFLRLGDGNDTADATLNINVGGTVETPYIDTANGATAAINFDGGILKALGSDIPEDTVEGTPAVMFLDTTGGATTFELNVMDDGAIIDTNGFTDTIVGDLLTGEAGDGGLTKLGLGELILAGTANTYLGETSVAAGTLTTTTNAMLSDTAAVRIEAGANMDLDFTGIADTVYSLYLDGVLQCSGTWGATGSGAQNTNDTYFSGTGTILVEVPEPSMLILLVGLAMAMAGCRIRQ